MLLQHPQAGMNSGSKSLHILGINQDLYIVLPRLHGAYGGKLQLRGDRHNGEKKNSATRHCFPVWRSHLPPEPLKSPPHCRLQSSVEASGWKEGGSHGGREQFHQPGVEGGSSFTRQPGLNFFSSQVSYSTCPPFLQQQYGLSSLLCKSVYCWHKNYRTLELVLHTTSKVLKLWVTNKSLCLLTATSSIKEHELTTWWGEWAHVIQNLGTEHKGKHHEEN